MLDYSAFLEKALYTCVRVTTGRSGGSGTVIHSSPENGTFILTCQHVIDDAVVIKEEWSSVLQRYVKRDVKSPVWVEFFKYSFKDRAVGEEKIEAEIIAYDKNEDIAVLRLKDDTVRKYVAEIEEDPYILQYFDEVITIGSALGHPPIATKGNLCSFNDIIENRDYMLCTAPAIYGNSGGATFLTKNLKLIGIPARISVIISGFLSTNPIAHMSYIIPFWRIKKFFEEQILYFLYDKNYTYEQCMKIREEKRRKAELDLLLEESKK